MRIDGNAETPPGVFQGGAVLRNAPLSAGPVCPLSN